MKERLIQLLDLEHLSPSKFADIIGVQRSSISHVLSGRNKPSFDFIQKTLKAFPGLNASWLIMGEGTMYEQMGRNVSGNLFDPPVIGAEESFPGNISDQLGSDVDAAAPESPISTEAEHDMHAVRSAIAEELISGERTEESGGAVSTDKKKIVQVMVIYEDDTFKAFTPAH